MHIQEQLQVNGDQLSFYCRQRAGGGRMRGSDASKRPGARDRTSRAVGAPDANAELAVSLEVGIFVQLL